MDRSKLCPNSSRTVSKIWNTPNRMFLQMLGNQFNPKLENSDAGRHEYCFVIVWNLVMRFIFYIKHYVLPPASFGIFVAAEAAVLYGLYRAFVAP